MNEQPEALQHADKRPWQQGDDLCEWALEAEDMLRRLHAEVEQLRAQLEAIGAGGVEPLRKRGCLHQIQEAA